MKPSIIFGTDGWRGVIADDFTFANLELVALAAARYFRTQPRIKRGVVIGYDARFLSREFAEHTARVLAENGLTVHLADAISSTPMVSLAAKAFNCAGGIIITASHNPARYNGFKLKGWYGGPAHPEMIQRLEHELGGIMRKTKMRMHLRPTSLHVQAKRIRMTNLTQLYREDLQSKIDIRAIRRSGLRILHDPMYGAGMGAITAIIPTASEIHGTFNPSFGGTHPEPIEPNLRELMTKTRKEGFDLGIATDGDADRIGLVDERGNFVDSHRIFSLLLKYLHDDRGWRGEVVKTVSVTDMVDEQCREYGLKLHLTPVGFKHVCRLMIERDILIGGEESGGLGVKGHLPERDGVYLGLLMAEIMVKRQKSLSDLVGELHTAYGKRFYKRIDHHVSPAEKGLILKRFTRGIGELAGCVVRRIDRMDGFKLFFDDAWLLVRPSGTEPLIRFYAEAHSKAVVDKLLRAALKG